MQTQTINQGISNKDVFVKMILDEWQKQLSRFNRLLDTLTGEQLLMEIAPGRNTGIYLAGHLVAVHDGMLPLLGFGEKLYPQLENIFLTNPDKSGIAMPSATELKKYRDEIDAKLSQHISQLSPDEWFAKHNAVSAEDFEKEPHRNKLNVVINRTNHLSYHLGQLALLAKAGGNE